MARLIQVDRDTLSRASGAFEPPPPLPQGWKVARPHIGEGLTPWFELTPHSPFVDTRVGPGATGLAATLETFGGVTGPSMPDPTADHVILGGALVAAGSPPPADVDELRRQAGLRITLDVDDLSGDRDCLLMIGLLGIDVPFVQVFLGRTGLAERPVVGEERLAVLVPARGALRLDLRLRVAGHSGASRLGVLGVHGFLL